MKKYINIKKIAFFLLTAIFITIFSIIYFFPDFQKYFGLLSPEQKKIVKKYFIPFKTISDYELKIGELRTNNSEYLTKNKGYEIVTSSVKIENLEKNLILKKYKLLNGFSVGINLDFPGSGFLDLKDEKLILLSARGVLAYGQLVNDRYVFQQIKNNIYDFINENQFKKSKRFSIKDLKVIDNQIFVSFTEEIKKNCWNTSVIQSSLNFENLNFKKLFTPKNCLNIRKSKDLEFHAHQSGGRIIKLNNHEILLSIGDYRSRYLAQEKDNVNGKIISVNLKDSSYKIFSMGHRNIQGLFIDKKNNFVLATEHGPAGGDEINLIELNSSNIPNYGWAVSSYGEHYKGGKKSRKNKSKYKKYPLYKSHSDFGFIEPLKYFTPSIGISEIVKIKEKSYVVSSLKDESLFFFNLNDQKEIEIKFKIDVGERIRDIIIQNNNLIMFMENTASIGFINLNTVLEQL